MTQRLQPATRALVALGTNLSHDGQGGPVLLNAALDAIEARGLALLAMSSAWASPAWPPSDQPDFTNAVAAFDSGPLSPEAVYAELRAVEAAFGRERRERWSARTLDLDLIDLDGLHGDFNGIILPHPRAHQRAFVLAPLAEIAPDWRPFAGAPAALELLAGLDPSQNIRRIGPLRENMPPKSA